MKISRPCGCEILIDDKSTLDFLPFKVGDLLLSATVLQIELVGNTTVPYEEQVKMSWMAASSVPCAYTLNPVLPSYYTHGIRVSGTITSISTVALECVCRTQRLHVLATRSILCAKGEIKELTTHNFKLM